ncbi:sigma-70 family RNA polymerase sigma factor [Candidatus Uhrbacteria bacterium]|nr:sigma-70 family RNA polymerase sigma factor [Candidatus Uhrbacteria bacterium]
MGNSKANNMVFLRGTDITNDERDAWDSYRRHRAYELMNEEEFLRRFEIYREAERAFIAVENRFKKLVADGEPVPVDTVEELESSRRKRDRLRNPLILANMRLVFKIAGRYTGRGLDFVDLAQEGYFGLVRTLENYEPERGFQFSTYAAWWVRSFLQRAILDISIRRAMRVPVHFQEQGVALRREEAKFESLYGRCPDDTELIAFMSTGKTKVSRLSKEVVNKLRLVPFMGGKVSIDASISGDDERSVLAFMRSGCYSPETLALARQRLAEVEEEIKDVVENANLGMLERNNAIMRMRFGIGGRLQTLNEIGAAFAITRERVRQITARRLKDHGYTEQEFRNLLESAETIREALATTQG